MNNTSIAPRFRLLVHGQDGSIPYLTPELLRLIFYPEAEETDNERIVEDGKMHRELMILGLAVKDTCITPDYQENKTRKKKRKGNTCVVDGNDKLLLQKLNDTSAVNTSSRNASTDTKDSDHTRENQQHQDPNKKPIGYSFLDKPKSSRICDLLDGSQDESTSSSTYLEKYLCTPQQISTLIVPTFSFVASRNDTTFTSSDEKKFIPKKQEADQSQPKKCSGSNIVIPKSTKDAVSIETPHGWQSIRPEQYSETVSSLLLSNSKIVKGNCEGIVGLFDHIELTSAQSDSLFLENTTNNNDDSGSCIERVQAKKQAQRKITSSLQKGNDWACRVHQALTGEEEQPKKFWLPVQLLASQLPSHVVFTTRNNRPNIENKIECKEQQFLSSHPNVAIIGWEALECGSNQRRKVLRSLMSTLQSKSTIPKKFLLLAVDDVQSILDAAREGVSIIGSDIARLRSRDGIALCFDFESENGICAKEMDLKDTRFARDFSPLISNCTSLACRPRKNGAPSFTRAYVHHLIQAKEMLAEILLFTHNLHQLILLFRELSKAAILDDRSEKKENLETLCRNIERSLASVKTAL